MSPADSGRAAAVPAKCRLCKAVITPDFDSASDIPGVCAACCKHPDARKRPTARGFSVADKSLIAKVRGYMPAQQLLEILNDRLVADVGAGAAPHTMEQLYSEMKDIAQPGGGGDWAGLRTLLAQARRNGVLKQISVETINDFAVVFSLTPAQVLRCKDVLLPAIGELK